MILQSYANRLYRQRREDRICLFYGESMIRALNQFPVHKSRLVHRNRVEVRIPSD